MIKLEEKLKLYGYGSQTLEVGLLGTKYDYMFFKTIIGFFLSLIAIVLSSPIFLVVWALIKTEDGGPAIFVQTRVGKDGKVFRMYKFRSMCIDAEKKIEELKDLNEADGLAFKIAKDPRVTRVGRFIRKTSIDELPQLFNILKGEMAIVGPRPPLVCEVHHYNDYQMQRLSVKPGLTCYWQCCGRSGVSFDEWMDMDMKYIKERSLWVDIKIVLKTIPAVLFGRGAC